MSTPSTATVSRRVSPRRRVSASASVVIAAAAAAGSLASAAAAPAVVASASTRTTTRSRAGSATAAAAAALVSVPVTPPPKPRSVGTTTTRRRTVMPAAEAEPESVPRIRHTSRYFSPSSPASGHAEIESSSWTMRRRSPRRAVVPVTPFASSSSLEEDNAHALMATPTPARRGRKMDGPTAGVKTKRPAPPSSAAAADSTGGKKGGSRKRRTPKAASESSSAVEEGSGDKVEEVEVEVERTSSFGPLWAGSLRTATLGTRPAAPPSEDGNASTTTRRSTPVHTLILGTHPSVKSLSRTQYYAHPMNAFWWIAGDALGFRRDTGVSPSSGKPYVFASSLRHHGAGKVLPYEGQVEVLTSKGFALWDLIGSCRREGSLDQDITEEVPNDVRGFCAEHPEVTRIVLANGASKQLQLFLKHFRDWWDDEGVDEGDDDGSGSGLAAVLVPGESVVDKMGKRYARRREDLIRTGGGSGGDTIGRRRRRRFIEVEAPMSVSPAAARFTYEQKRDDWERFCYIPGLRDRERLVGRGSSSGGEVL